MSATAWSLHPQLESDTAPVGDLALSQLLSINDAIYPWLILVPRCAGAAEITDLSADDAACLIEEIALASRALRRVSRSDRINVAAIGNVVPQLHVHIVARWTNDPLWPKPVWGARAVQAGTTAAFERFVAAIQSELTP